MITRNRQSTHNPTGNPVHDPQMRLRPLERSLLAELGKNYKSKWIDGIEVIYRDLNRFDMEITYDGQRRHCYITVWQKSPMVSVEKHVEYYTRLHEVRARIEEIAAKYEQEAVTHEG